MRNQYVNMIVWMAITAVASFLLTRFLGLYIGLAASFGLFILLNIIMRKRAMGKYNLGSMGMGVTYRCIVCGHRFKSGSCPRCGSKMKSAEF